MKDIAVADVRNIVLMGHTGSGKTTLADALLVKLGLADKMGLVSAGTSAADTMEEEIKRKITVQAKTFVGVYKTRAGRKVQIVFSDVPGVDDFAGQMLSASSVADSTLLVVDAVAGIQVGSTRAWKRMTALQRPSGIVITGLDRENANFNKVVEQIQGLWGKKCLPMTMPASDLSSVLDVTISKDASGSLAETSAEYRNAIMEIAAETDDQLVEKYLGGEALNAEELAVGIRKAILTGSLIPVFAVAPLKDVGLVEFLEALARAFPSPADIQIKDADGQEINSAADAPVVAWVWKMVTDPYAGKLAYVRIFGGTLKPDMELLNLTQGHKEKIGTFLVPTGRKPAPGMEASAGDIVALAKLKNTVLGDVLVSPGAKASFAPISFPTPVVFYAISAKDRGDEDKIGLAVSRVAEDDPTFKVDRNADTREMVISGMGDIHIEVALEFIKKRSNVSIELATPKVSYKETVTAVGEGHYRHKKQTGGRGQFAEVYCRVLPLPEGEEWFEDAVVGGVIPRNFIPACEKGFVDALKAGVLASYPVVNVRVSVYDGSYHDVDSSEIAFKIAASRAFREGMSKAKPVLLEPIMSVRIMAPDQFMGDINGDMNHRRGRIMGMEMEDGAQVIAAEVPQAEMFRYCSELRSMTGGRGSFEMKFARYEVVPSSVAQKVIASAEKAKEEDEDA